MKSSEIASKYGISSEYALNTYIKKHATLKNVDEWGKRKLAYLINKESEGYYVLFDFESTAEFPAELDRIFKITEGVMRSLIIKKEDE